MKTSKKILATLIMLAVLIGIGVLSRREHRNGSPSNTDTAAYSTAKTKGADFETCQNRSLAFEYPDATVISHIISSIADRVDFSCTGFTCCLKVSKGRNGLLVDKQTTLALAKAQAERKIVHFFIKPYGYTLYTIAAAR